MWADNCCEAQTFKDLGEAEYFIGYHGLKPVGLHFSMLTYRLSIITPNGKTFEGQIESLVARGTAGSLGIWARHAPMVTSLVKGPLIIKRDGKESYFALSTGLLEVNEQRNVLLLADIAVRVDTFEQAKEGAARYPSV